MNLERAKEADKLLQSLARNKGIETMSINAFAEEVGMEADLAHHYFHIFAYDNYTTWRGNPCITGKGLLFIEDGGYTALIKKEIANNIWIIVAAIASVVAAITGIIMLLK